MSTTQHILRLQYTNSEFNSRQALRFPPQRDLSLWFLSLWLPADSSCSRLLSSLDGGAACSPAALVMESCPALGRQMVWRRKGLCPAAHWNCESSHLEKTVTPTRVPKKSAFKAQMSWLWSWFRNICRNSCAWQECVYLFCKRKVVKRQGVQHDKIEICSRRPNLGWKIIE